VRNSGSAVSVTKASNSWLDLSAVFRFTKPPDGRKTLSRI
jgi:hypothetical protein